MEAVSLIRCEPEFLAQRNFCHILYWQPTFNGSRILLYILIGEVTQTIAMFNVSFSVPWLMRRNMVSSLKMWKTSSD